MIIIPLTKQEAFANFPFSANHTLQSPEVHHTPPITSPDLTTALEAWNVIVCNWNKDRVADLNRLTSVDVSNGNFIRVALKNRHCPIVIVEQKQPFKWKRKEKKHTKRVCCREYSGSTRYITRSVTQIGSAVSSIPVIWDAGYAHRGTKDEHCKFSRITWPLTRVDLPV